MKFILIAILLIAFGCSTADNHNKPTSQTLSTDQLTALQIKYTSYSTLVEAQQNPDGFLLFDTCDSLLFSGLLGTLKAVNIEAARDSDGMWHRKPLNLGECYDGTPTNSTISRDMLLGLLWYIWENKRLDLANDLFAYGEAHNWIMGKGDISRTYMTPGLQATLADIIYHLSGQNHLVYRSIPQVYTVNTGFEAHLDALSGLLRAEVTGEMDAQAFSLMNTYYNRNTNNALFSYAYHRYGDGDQTKTAASLLNEQWFPVDRLPTSADRSDPWIWQRDYGSDWQPSTQQPPETWSGGDFLFVAHLLLRAQ